MGFGHSSPNVVLAPSILASDSSGYPLFVPQGDPISPDPNRAGPATLQPGSLYTVNGDPIQAYQNTSNNMAWNTDCHGYTLTGGHYWIDNDAMQSLLGAQSSASTPLVVPTNSPSLNDWVVYSDASGNVVHSGVMSSPGMVTMAAGTVIYQGPDGPSKTTTVPISQGWTAPGTTIQYWHPQP